MEINVHERYVKNIYNLKYGNISLDLDKHVFYTNVIRRQIRSMPYGSVVNGDFRHAFYDIYKPRIGEILSKKYMGWMSESRVEKYFMCDKTKCNAPRCAFEPCKISQINKEFYKDVSNIMGCEVNEMMKSGEYDITPPLMPCPVGLCPGEPTTRIKNFPILDIDKMVLDPSHIGNASSIYIFKKLFCRA